MLSGTTDRVHLQCIPWESVELWEKKAGFNLSLRTEESSFSVPQAAAPGAQCERRFALCFGALQLM